MTKKLYLSDSYLYECAAEIIEIRPSEIGTEILLDQTIFYPKGGGQASDVGRILIENIWYDVVRVFLDESGQVIHVVSLGLSNELVGRRVELEINKTARDINAKLHSAGHIIDLATKELVKISTLKNPRGSHIFGQSFVLYEGSVESKEVFLSEIQKKVDDFIHQDLSFFVENLSDSQAKEMGVISPDGKNPRYVFIENYKSVGSGCGGTHILSTKELAGLRIKKISNKKGMVRISYEIL